MAFLIRSVPVLTKRASSMMFTRQFGGNGDPLALWTSGIQAAFYSGRRHDRCRSRQRSYSPRRLPEWRGWCDGWKEIWCYDDKLFAVEVVAVAAAMWFSLRICLMSFLLPKNRKQNFSTPLCSEESLRCSDETVLQLGRDWLAAWRFPRSSLERQLKFLFLCIVFSSQAYRTITLL